MQVIAHDRVAVGADCENLAELLKTGFDDGFSVLAGFAGVAVNSTELSTPHAAGNAVEGTALARFEEIVTRIGHGGDGRLSTSGLAVGRLWGFL